MIDGDEVLLLVTHDWIGYDISCQGMHACIKCQSRTNKGSVVASPHNAAYIINTS
jgi:hypothetical protein